MQHFHLTVLHSIFPQMIESTGSFCRQGRKDSERLIALLKLTQLLIVSARAIPKISISVIPLGCFSRREARREKEASNLINRGKVTSEVMFKY